MPMLKSFFAAACVCVAAGAMSAGPAAAQGREALDAERKVLEEIIVTAQKRTENLQDIGQSVQAIDAEGLAKAGIDDISRLELIGAGVSYGMYGNDAKVALRGTNSNNTFADNSAIVGFFVDGVYKPRASQQTRSFFDVQRLEVLKGPQGTLYGRNTFGGAINLYTNEPDLSGRSAELSVTASRFSALRLEGHLNAPVTDNFALRFAGLTNNSDGHISNDAAQNFGIKDNRAFRISAKWQPSDRLELVARYTNIKENGTTPGVFAATGICRPVTANGLTDVAGGSLDCGNPRRGSGGTPGWDFFGVDRISRDFVPDADLTEENVTVDLTWSLDALDIRSISSYTDYNALLGDDGDLSSNRFGRQWMDERAESWTQELQFVSAGTGPLQWTGGLYYSRDNTFFQFSTFNISQDDLSVRPLAPDAQGNLLPVLIGTPLVDGTISYNGAFTRPQDIEIDTYGAFGQAEYSLTDRLRVIGGLRYNLEEKTIFSGTNFDGTVTFLAPDVTDPIPTTPGVVFVIDRSNPAATRNSDDWSEVTWRAGLEYDASDSTMAYFSASTGFLSGSLNGTGTVTDQQESEAFEIGLKSRFLDERLQVNVAAYRNEYTNLATQVQTTLPTGTVVTNSVNGGDIEANGLEIELVALIGEGLTINANASFLDAEYGVFGTSNPYQLFQGVQQGFIDLAGETPPWAPEFTFSLRFAYDVDLGDAGILTPLVQFAYSDEYTVSGFNLPQDPGASQDAYSKTDLRLSWTSADGAFGLEAFVENIEDEDVLARSQIGGEDLLQTTYLFPRNFGVKARYSF